MTSRAGAEAAFDEIRLDEVDLGPGVVAGFTDRHGGVSAGPYASFNLGAHVDDDPRAVATNRERLAARLRARVAFGDQVHGTHVIEVAHAAALDDDPLVPVGTGDALVTRADDVALGVLVADCVPVLLADPDARVVAVAHAGRRGLLDGVVQATLQAMAGRGADVARVRAAIGPAVAGSSYEVPAALRDEVAAVVPQTAATTAWGTPALDLPSGVEALLRAAGVEDVRRSARDTWAEPDLFSYRREPRTGRFAGVIRLV